MEPSVVSNFSTKNSSAYGNTVLVNGKNTYSNFYADLIDYEIAPASISSDLFKTIGKQSYIANQYKVGDNSIKLKFYVAGSTKQEAQINVNKLLSEFHAGNNSLLGDLITYEYPTEVSISDTDFIYSGFMVANTVEYTGVYFYYYVEIDMVAAKTLSIVEQTVYSNNVSFESQGCIKSGLRIVVVLSSPQDVSTIAVTSGVVNNHNTINIVTAGRAVHIIDGILGKIQSGASVSGASNSFGNSDLIDFPVVFPNVTNTISVTCYNFSDSVVQGVNYIAYSYYPTFEV